MTNDLIRKDVYAVMSYSKEEGWNAAVHVNRQYIDYVMYMIKKDELTVERITRDGIILIAK